MAPINTKDAIIHWIAGTALHLLLPLAPLFIEYTITNDIGVLSLTLSAAMYSVSTGLGSKNIAVFIISLLIFFFYSAIYGAHMMGSLSTNQKYKLDDEYALYTIIALLITNIVLKFIYHVINKNPLTDISISR